MPEISPAPSAEFAEFVASCTPAARDLALRAREMLLSRERDLIEKVWPGWKVVGYGTGPKMADVVVALGPAKSHLRVVLMDGLALPDPEGMLQGTGKNARHVIVESPAMLDSPAVRSLIEAAFAHRRGAAPDSAAAPAAQWDAPMSDEAVAAATGRTWDEWVAALDAHGCATKTHKEIVTIVRNEFGIGPWWQQSVTVGYERARGLRKTHQAVDGYQVGASRTIAVDLRTLWWAWANAQTRRQWLADDFTIRKATEPKSLRITWNDGSDLQVMFYPKGSRKSQVTVDHRKLPAGPRVEELKAFWRERLDALKSQLENS